MSNVKQIQEHIGNYTIIYAENEGERYQVLYGLTEREAVQYRNDYQDYGHFFLPEPLKGPGYRRAVKPVFFSLAQIKAEFREMDLPTSEVDN